MSKVWRREPDLNRRVVSQRDLQSPAIDRSAISPYLERVEGIEPSTLAWKAKVLPLNYTRAEGTSMPFLQARCQVFFCINLNHLQRVC